jgi:uncharacterized protein YjiS (DUF1127 family)
MPCGSTAYIATNHIETASLSCLDPGWSWQIPLSWLTRIASKIAMGLERRHQRRELLGLDDRLLADIGISREQAVEEVLKSSWTHIFGMWHLSR